MLVLGFPEYQLQARALASALDASCVTIDLHQFPDGESRLRLPSDLPDHIVLCRSLDRPNEKLVELMLAAHAARELGVGQITQEHSTLLAFDQRLGGSFVGIGYISTL